MATETAKPAAGDTEIDRIALQIFANRAALTHGSPASAADAVKCYKEEATFIRARGQFHAGEFDPQVAKGPQLADCCAPNLPKTHPHNLVSGQMGDLTKVASIQKFLVANPNPKHEGGEQDIINALNRQFALGWTFAELRTARVIFPQYVAA